MKQNSGAAIIPIAAIGTTQLASPNARNIPMSVLVKQKQHVERSQEHYCLPQPKHTIDVREHTISKPATEETKDLKICDRVSKVLLLMSERDALPDLINV